MSIKLIELIYSRQLPELPAKVRRKGGNGSISLTKTVLVHLAESANADGSRAFKSKLAMMAELQCSKATVIDALEALVKLGLVTRVGKRFHKGAWRMEHKLEVAAIEALSKTWPEKQEGGSDLNPLEEASDAQGGSDPHPRGFNSEPKGVQIRTQGGSDLNPTRQRTRPSTQEENQRESARETRATHSVFSGSPEEESRAESWSLTDEDREHGRREGMTDAEIDIQAAELIDQIADGRRRVGKNGRAQWRSWVRSFVKYKAEHPTAEDSEATRKRLGGTWTSMGFIPTFSAKEAAWGIHDATAESEARREAARKAEEAARAESAAADFEATRELREAEERYVAQRAREKSETYAAAYGDWKSRYDANNAAAREGEPVPYPDNAPTAFEFGEEYNKRTKADPTKADEMPFN